MELPEPHLELPKLSEPVLELPEAPQEIPELPEPLLELPEPSAPRISSALPEGSSLECLWLLWPGCDIRAAPMGTAAGPGVDTGPAQLRPPWIPPWISPSRGWNVGDGFEECPRLWDVFVKVRIGRGLHEELGFGDFLTLQGDI